MTDQHTPDLDMATGEAIDRANKMRPFVKDAADRAAEEAEGQRVSARADSRTDSASIILRRAIEPLAAISDEASLVLQQGTDDLDTLKARIRAHQAKLAADIAAFAQYSMDAVVAGKQIIEAAKRAAVPFDADPPSTFTSNSGDQK